MIDNFSQFCYLSSKKLVSFWRARVFFVMKSIKSQQISRFMEVINKPKINYTKKSLQFFFLDRRKVISAVAILSLPFLNQLWRLAPEGIEISYYNSFDTFIWNFCLNFTFVVISVAWYFSVPKKDQVFTISVIAICRIWYLFNLCDVTTHRCNSFLGRHQYFRRTFSLPFTFASSISKRTTSTNPTIIRHCTTV